MDIEIFVKVIRIPLPGVWVMRTVNEKWSHMQVGYWNSTSKWYIPILQVPESFVPGA